MAWEQLLDIIREARQLADMERNQPPAACPNDGEPLETGPGGVLHCKYDGWTWSGTTTG